MEKGKDFITDKIINKVLTFLLISRCVIENITIEDCLSKYIIKDGLPDADIPPEPKSGPEALAFECSASYRIRLVRREKPIDISSIPIEEIKFLILQNLSKALKIEI